VEPELDQVAIEVRTARLEIARTTRDELARAGLPIRESGGPNSAGAEIEVDFGDDGAGGVFVTWHADSGLTEAAAQSVLAGRLNDPAIQQSGTISTAMRDAMVAILVAARCVAEPSGDDMRPLALRVLSSPSEPPMIGTWRISAATLCAGVRGCASRLMSKLMSDAPYICEYINVFKALIASATAGRSRWIAQSAVVGRTVTASLARRVAAWRRSLEPATAADR
jgi:hypothetical protein